MLIVKRIVTLLLVISLMPFFIAFADKERLFGVPLLSSQDIRQHFRSLQRVSPLELDLSLTFDGVALPRLKDGETYYLPICQGNIQALQGSLSANDSYTLAFHQNSIKGSIFDMMADGKALPLYIRSNNAHSVIYLVFTSLPVLSLTSRYDTITRDEQRCAMSLLSPKKDGNLLQSTSSLATIRLRGATSANLTKKPFKLELHRTQYLDTRKISLLNMRKDDDWILYPAHSDESKIRDAVAWRLWEIISNPTDGHASGALQNRYVEVLMDGEYAGFYLLMERFDEKTLDLGKNDVLFKSLSWVRPTAAQIRSQPPHSAKVLDIEKKYPEPEDNIDGNWDIFADYVKLVYEDYGKTFTAGIAECADIENMLDYWLFLQVTMATDNSLKNIYFAQIDNKIHAYPWDLDYSFGMSWSKDAHNSVYRYPDVAQTLLDFECGQRLILYYPGAANYLKQRWQALTVDSPLLTSDGIMAIAREYWNELHLSGAWNRNQKRWPDGNYTDQLDYFNDITQKRFQYLDDYIHSLKDAGRR